MPYQEICKYNNNLLFIHIASFYNVTQWINFPTVGVESTAIGREGAKSLSFC